MSISSALHRAGSWRTEEGSFWEENRKDRAAKLEMSLVGWDWKHTGEQEWTELVDKERVMGPGPGGPWGCAEGFELYSQ